MTQLKLLKKKLLTDQKVKAYYKKQETEFAISRTLIAARIHAGLTQAQVARKMKTTQSVIARLEGGTTLPSMASIIKYANAVGRYAQIKLLPK